MIVNFRHLSPRKSVSGHFWIGSSDCRRAEKNCIVNSNHLNNMACLLLSLNMAPLFATSQLWHPLFSREGKGDLCFQLRSINWLPLLLLFLLLILAFFFFSFDVWYGATTWSTSLSASKFMFVFRWSFSFPFPLLADFVSVCFSHLLHRIDHFCFLSDMRKHYQGRKSATANRRPFWKVIWSNFRIWFSSFYLWCSKTPSS